MNKKILGMGNAVLDIVTSVSEKFLESKNLSKGSMVLVDQEISDQILKEIEPVKKDSGGSVANTIVGISLLGQNSLFCGKVKKDQLGDEFISDMEETNTNFLCSQSSKGLPTARCVIFVTPDGERSMQTFLGASTTLDADDIKEVFFEDIEYLMIEGYLWSSDSARKAIKKAVDFAINKGVKIVFSLSDVNLVKMFKEDFTKFIKSYVQILIGNENEYKQLLEDSEENDFIRLNNIEIMLKTLGSNGVCVIEPEKTEIIPAMPVSSVVDTTGAGDMFAAGFLYKLLKGNKPLDSASFGCKVAAIIIQQYGARPKKEDLKKLVN